MNCCGMWKRSCLWILLLIAAAIRAGAGPAEALTLEVDPGEAGTKFSLRTFPFVGALDGTELNGQTRSVDIVFKEKKFAAAGTFRITLSISQSGDLGTAPAGYFSVKGHLLDAKGKPMEPLVEFKPTMTMPAQIWPGWGYFLPDGKEYVPATTGYEADFAGKPMDMDRRNNFLYDPIVFTGVHFEITFPRTPATRMKGLSVTLSDFQNQVHVSPDPMPKFKGHMKKKVETKGSRKKNKWTK